MATCNRATRRDIWERSSLVPRWEPSCAVERAITIHPTSITGITTRTRLLMAITRTTHTPEPMGMEARPTDPMAARIGEHRTTQTLGPMLAALQPLTLTAIVLPEKPIIPTLEPTAQLAKAETLTDRGDNRWSARMATRHTHSTRLIHMVRPEVSRPRLAARPWEPVQHTVILPRVKPRAAICTLAMMATSTKTRAQAGRSM